MQMIFDGLPDEIAKATKTLKEEGERLVQEERLASSKEKERCRVLNKVPFYLCLLSLCMQLIINLRNLIAILIPFRRNLTT